MSAIICRCCGYRYRLEREVRATGNVVARFGVNLPHVLPRAAPPLEPETIAPRSRPKPKVPEPAMPNRKPHRQSAARAKTLLLPMARKEASVLILRTRLNLERRRSGETDRSLINHLLQICLITAFVTRAGYGQLAIEHLDRMERELGELLNEVDDTGRCECRETLMEEITQVVNEYDRMLGAVRLEIFARASDHLERLMAAAANVESFSANAPGNPASPR